MFKFRLIIVLAAFAALISLNGCRTTGEKNVKLAEVHYKLGVSHLEESKLQHAFIQFQKAIEFDPENKVYYNALGNVYIMLKDPGNAEKSFSEAVAIDQKYSDAYNNLCFVYISTKKYEKAIEACKRALENTMYFTPEKAFLNLGRSYYSLGRLSLAADAYNNALLRSPTLYPAYYNLALVYNAKGSYGEAATALTKAIEYDPRFEGDIRKAEGYFRTADIPLEDKADIKTLLEIINY